MMVFLNKSVFYRDIRREVHKLANLQHIMCFTETLMELGSLVNKAV